MHSEQFSFKNLVAQPWSVLLLVCNFVGAVVYVTAASNGWVTREERALGLHSVTGEPYIWALSVMPICVVFLLLNLIWRAFILCRRQWRCAPLWLLTIPIWVVAVIIDFSHH